MDTSKITLIANQAIELLAFNINRIGARIQNTIAAPLYISKTNPPPMTVESIILAPASDPAKPTEYRFDDQQTCYEQWFVKCALAGDVGVRVW